MDTIENISSSDAAADGDTTEPCWSRIGIDGDGSCPELKTAVHCCNCHVFTDAARGLFDRPIMDDYREEWTSRLLAEAEVQKRSTHSVLIFSLQSEFLALPTTVFSEVTDIRAIHRIPGAPGKLLLGLVNIHGELHLCASLSALLGIEPVESATVPAAGKGRMLLMQRGGEAWVFPVDEVHDVYRYNDESLQPLPATVERSPLRFSAGTLDWQGKTVGRLDETAVFDALKGSMT